MVNAVIDQTGTNTTIPPSAFGNSIEPGGLFSITTSGGGAAAFVSIETELFKDVNGNWVSQGAATAAQANQTTGVWSNLRYNNLAAGKYKVVATLKYNQTNPVPANANPQSTGNTFGTTFK